MCFDIYFAAFGDLILYNLHVELRLDLRLVSTGRIFLLLGMLFLGIYLMICKLLDYYFYKGWLTGSSYLFEKDFNEFVADKALALLSSAAFRGSYFVLFSNRDCFADFYLDFSSLNYFLLGFYLYFNSDSDG